QAQRHRVLPGPFITAGAQSTPPAHAGSPGGAAARAAGATLCAPSMKYQTAVPIGSGGMGEVYKAFDPVLKRWVALKYPRWDRPDLAERFLREDQLQARVDHRGVCKVYEVGREQDGRAFIAMQYVEGAVLETAAQEMTLIEKVEVMRRVA